MTLENGFECKTGKKVKEKSENENEIEGEASGSIEKVLKL